MGPKRVHVGPRSGFVTYAIDLATLQSCPHVRVSLQHVVLRKKMHEVCMRYLASDIHADVLAWLGLQQRSGSASEFHAVELDTERYTLCVLGAN